LKSWGWKRIHKIFLDIPSALPLYDGYMTAKGTLLMKIQNVIDRRVVRFFAFFSFFSEVCLPRS
jgi:hypothetical protein